MRWRPSYSIPFASGGEFMRLSVALCLCALFCLPVTAQNSATRQDDEPSMTTDDVHGVRPTSAYYGRTELPAKLEISQLPPYAKSHMGAYYSVSDVELLEIRRTAPRSEQ